MAHRKWNTETIASWISEAADERLRGAAQSPAAEDIALLEGLLELDSVALQSLGVRLGRYVWERWRIGEDLQDMAATILRFEAANEPQPAMHRAFLRCVSALREAVALGETPVASPYDPVKSVRLTDSVIRGRSDGDSVVTAGLVRALIEPLLGGDRSAFRSRLGEIGGALVRLDSLGQGSVVENLAEMPYYWELKSLQWLLNGVLQASRAPLGVRRA